MLLPYMIWCPYDIFTDSWENLIKTIKKIIIINKKKEIEKEINFPMMLVIKELGMLLPNLALPK